eukprot:gene12833-15686_t
MKNELTLNVLQTMSAQEYEDIRAAGSDERRELTHAVMRELDAPDNWTMNGEYGSEFGGFFPVQVRFTPAHERFHLALCSPGDVSQVWVLVLVNAGGEPFAVVQVQRRFAPEAVSHSLALAASLDAQGYSVSDIIHILMAEGGQALVPLSTEQQAAWRAVAETEKRRHQGNTLAEYPYAGAFFRCLNGSRRISLSDLRFFMPSLTAEELHGNRLQWLYAIDVLIETQGEVCLLPLPGDAAERLFPSVRFRVRERSRHKSALVMQKYSRQQAREAEQKARAYQALVAQAEIELAFHSPETVGSWHARWSDRVAEHDLETLFWQWGERFPSLAGMERWQWQDMPFWQVIAEADGAVDGAEQTPGGSVMRQQSHGFPVNGLNERIIFRESECGQRAGIWAMMCPALEAFCLMT